MENTSGHGPAAVVPAEIDRWNWGAFLLNWIWGIGNNTMIALLVFVPFVNIVMFIMLGVKGSAWAWQNKRWESVDHFKAVQLRWTRWALGLLVGAMALFALLGYVIFSFVGAELKNTTAYTIISTRLDTNEEAIALLGKPIHKDLPQGQFSVEGADGNAHFTFKVNGPKSAGVVKVEATKTSGIWAIDEAVLVPDDSDHEIDLAEPGEGRPD